jgi:hypothetical protein
MFGDLTIPPWWNYAVPQALEPQFHLQNPRILNTHKEIFIQIEFVLILDVWWFESWYIPQALEIPIFAWRNTPTKRNEQNTVLVVFLTYISMILECVQKRSTMGLVQIINP